MINWRCAVCSPLQVPAVGNVEADDNDNLPLYSPAQFPSSRPKLSVSALCLANKMFIKQKRRKCYLNIRLSSRGLFIIEVHGCGCLTPQYQWSKKKKVINNTGAASDCSRTIFSWSFTISLQWWCDVRHYIHCCSLSTSGANSIVQFLRIRKCVTKYPSRSRQPSWLGFTYNYPK